MYTGVRTINTNCHPVVGIILDKHGVVASACFNRPTDRLDHDDDEWFGASNAPQSVLHQGMLKN